MWHNAALFLFHITYVNIDIAERRKTMKNENLSKKFLTTITCPECGGRMIVEAIRKSKNDTFQTSCFFCNDCGINTIAFDDSDFEWENDGIALSPSQAASMPIGAGNVRKVFGYCDDFHSGDGERILFRNDGTYEAFILDKKPYLNQVAAVVEKCCNKLMDEMPGWTSYYNNKSISRTAYERYQLDWMISHGHSLEELFSIMDGIWSDDEYPDDHCPSDYFEDFESDTGFGGELYVCYDEFLGAEYQNKAYIKTLLSPEEYIVYLNDITPTEVPSGVCRAMCKACQHYFENKDGRGNCGYYEENANSEEPINDCAHFANNNEYDIYHLLYEEMYVAENIQTEDDVTVLDVVEYIKEHGTKTEQDEIKSILSLPDYNEEFWSLSAV